MGRPDTNADILGDFLALRPDNLPENADIFDWRSYPFRGHLDLVGQQVGCFSRTNLIGASA